MKVTLTWPEASEAARAGVTRRLHALAKGRGPRHHGWSGNVNYWGADIEGVGAEMAVAKALDRFWSPNNRPDKADIGERLGVRYTAYPNGHLILHPNDEDGHIFVLVVGAMPEYEVVGHVLGQDGKREEWWREGERPAFFVPQGNLTAGVPAMGGI